MESAETGLPARRTPSRPGQILSWDPWQPCRVPALGHPRSPHSAPAIFPRHFSSASPKSEGNTATGGRESRPQMSVLHFKEGWKGLWGEKVSDLFWLRLEKTSWEGNNAAAKSRPLSGRNSRPLPEVPGGLRVPCWARPGHTAENLPGTALGTLGLREQPPRRPHACLTAGNGTSTQRHHRAKTHRGKGSESAILLSDMWVGLYTLSATRPL